MNNVLAISLTCAVPLRIIEMKQRGGPSNADIEDAHSFADTLGSRGDVLLFGGGQRGEPARLFNDLVRAIAVLAFCPGGVEVFGTRYKGNPDDGQPPIRRVFPLPDADRAKKPKKRNKIKDRSYKGFRRP